MSISHFNEYSDKVVITVFITVAFWFVLLFISLIHLFQLPLIIEQDNLSKVTIIPFSQEQVDEELIIKALYRPMPQPPSPPLPVKKPLSKEKKYSTWDLGIDFAPVNLDLRCLPFLRNSIRKKIQVKQEYLQQQEQYQQQLQQQLLLLQQQLQLLNQQREQSQVQEQASIQNQAQEQAQEQVQELPQQEIRREEPLLITRPFYNTIQRRPTPFPTETTSEEEDYEIAIQKLKRQVQKGVEHYRKVERRLIETENQLDSLSYQINNDRPSRRRRYCTEEYTPSTYYNQSINNTSPQNIYYTFPTYSRSESFNYRYYPVHWSY
ncbi:hypothetical protein G6F37_011696 [Rhizopus arrhizus]|nr:hypothetical protein G6F38_011838 [Rhizopus arrhizus]KAG1147923.1 hypothetical protein G6F37_011696 [Rhizopus arrhizus]